AACASVAVDTPIDRVPAACQAAWRPFGVTLVPGLDLLSRVPHLPQVSVGPGVSTGEAARWSAAYWRTQACEWFAVRSRPVGRVDALGVGGLYQIGRAH